MGCETNYYVGPYLLLNNLPTEEVENGKKCPKCGTRNWIHIYCPECGSKCVSFMKTSEVHYESMLDAELEDYFYDATNYGEFRLDGFDGLVLIPNTKEYLSDEQAKDINPKDIVKSVDDFLHDAKEATSQLKAHGVKIAASFGAFIHYS